MKPEGWAVFEDGSIAYMGFATELGEFFDGQVRMVWKNVKMHAVGTVVGAGIKSGSWKCATYLSKPWPVVDEPGSFLTISIDLVVPEPEFPDIGAPKLIPRAAAW